MSIQPFNSAKDFRYDEYRDDPNEFRYEDDDDSNDEFNERNDYPDEDDEVGFWMGGGLLSGSGSLFLARRGLVTLASGGFTHS